MKVSHEVPRCLLLASQEFNDYDYCLPHLLDQDEEYKQYFYDAKKSGRYIIMDNSLHELGESYDNDRLLYWVGELKPNEFIVPDVWMEGHMTAAQAKYWKQFKYLDTDTHEESVNFLKGNLSNYVDIPCLWILLSITHKNNVSETTKKKIDLLTKKYWN